MKAPKILPRVAHKAGLSEELALKIWRRALSETEYLQGTHHEPDFFGLAVERFLKLVDEESGQNTHGAHATAPGIGWMFDHQARLANLSLTTAQRAWQSWQKNWQDALNGSKAA